MELNLISNIIGIAVIGNLIAYWFEPIQSTKTAIVNVFTFLPFVHRNLELAFNCSKCMSFWIYLLVFQDIIGAAICSLVGFMINFLISKIEYWYES